MSRRIPLALVLAAAVAAGGSVGAVPATGPRVVPTPLALKSADGPIAAAKAVAIRIVFPSGRVVASPAVLGSGLHSAASFSFPKDGAVIVTGANRASVATATVGRTGRANSSSVAGNISIFDGEITADSASAAASATAARSAGGNFQGTGVANLQAFGRQHAFGRAKLRSWGYLTIAEHSVDRVSPPQMKRYDAEVIGLDIHLTSPHHGLPAGTQIEIGYTRVVVQTAPPVLKPVVPIEPRPGDRPSLLPPTTWPLIGVPQVISPPLSAGPYLFPVFGRTRWADTYGNSKGDAPYQHGVDIRGSLGQPIVAVADGTLFSVGWSQDGGNAAWLRDRGGNEFYYAHLSAFSTLAQKNAHVNAGEVIGFMGDTGNSQGLPTHLHFEVRPVSMLFLGYDGAVDPGSYLGKWHHLQTLTFPVATGWAPTVPGTIKAPEPGAVLLGSVDISALDGLSPGSLLRVTGGSAHG